MASLIPIPTTRASDMLVSRRLLAQLQSDQRDMLRIQNQLSTGRRIFAPSEDSSAAQRAIVLQRLLEQKTQVEANREASQSYLTATESALANVGNLLADVRGVAVSISGTSAGQTERDTAVAQIRHAMEQLVNVGNQKFRGRFLFGGTQTVNAPFDNQGQFVVYDGNEGHLQSFADVALLVETNFHGNEVFGAISKGVSGQADLNPILTSQTRLADLRGGQGIGDGSFTISDGNHSTTIDIDSAETVGDVVNLIEGNAPQGRKLTARVSNTGLIIEIDSAGGGTLTITEVGGGKTAEELGILTVSGNGTLPIVGEDLDPVLRGTTQLQDILGVRSNTVVSSPTANSDLAFEFQQRGAAGDGLTIQFVDDDLLQAGGGLSAGNETVTYTDVPTNARAGLRLDGVANDLTLTASTAGTALNNVRIDITTAAIGDAANVNLSGNVLTIQIDSGGATMVGTLQNVLATDGNFTASFDNSLEAGVNSTATIAAGSAGANKGNTGNSGTDANTLLINIDAGATTANNVIKAVQNDPVANQLVYVSLDGKDAGFGAPGTGTISVDASAVTTGGGGIEFDQASGIQITNGEETHIIDLQSAETIEDLLNTFNASAANVIAEINAAGTGVNVRSRQSGADFFIGENGGQTATDLGLRTFVGQTRIDDLHHGNGIFTNDGADFTIHRNDGIELEIDVSMASTVQDVIDLINNHVDNLDPANAVVARLAKFSGGIELVDENPVSGDSLSVIALSGSTAAVDLGLIPVGETTSAPAVLDGTTEILSGRDVNPTETEGVFNSLARLIHAIESSDQNELERATQMLDVDFNRVSFTRGAIGAGQQSLDVLGQRLQDEQVELQRTLSVEVDVDMVEAISEFTQRQASFQASLQVSSQTFQLTLLDFL